MSNEEFSEITAVFEENLKKALTEFLVLQIISERDYYIGELSTAIHERSGKVLSIIFPYSAIYRLVDRGDIFECGKRHAPDGRRRQYYRITEQGKRYMAQLRATYDRFFGGVEKVLNGQHGREG